MNFTMKQISWLIKFQASGSILITAGKSFLGSAAQFAMCNMLFLCLQINQGWNFAELCLIELAPQFRERGVMYGSKYLEMQVFLPPTPTEGMGGGKLVTLYAIRTV